MKKKWKLSTCSCGWSQKNDNCRHVIDMALKKNMADYQLNAKSSGQTDFLPSTSGIQSNVFPTKNQTQTKS